MTPFREALAPVPFPMPHSLPCTTLHISHGRKLKSVMPGLYCKTMSHPSSCCIGTAMKELISKGAERLQ